MGNELTYALKLFWSMLCQAELAFTVDTVNAIGTLQSRGMLSLYDRERQSTPY